MPPKRDATAAQLIALQEAAPSRPPESVYSSSNSSSGRRSTRRPNQTLRISSEDEDLPVFPDGYAHSEHGARHDEYREGSDSDRRDAARACHAFNLPADGEQQAPPRKKRKTSPYFEQAEPSEDNNPDLIDIVDEGDRFKKIVQYKPIHPKAIKLLCGETINPDPLEKECVDAMLASVRPPPGSGVGMGRTTIPPLFTTLENRQHENITVKKSKCFLCEISEANIPDFIADRQASGTRDIRYSAYAQMTWNDLKYCGTKEEPELMQENTDIFNQEMARLAAAGKANCKAVTTDIMNYHLDMHDLTNPKRPVLKAMLEAKYLAKLHFDAIEGMTTDGTRVLRQTHTRLYFAARREHIAYANKFAAVCSYVNMYMLGEAHLTGKPLNAIAGAAPKGGAGDSRHMAIRKMAGTKMLGFLG